MATPNEEEVKAQLDNVRAMRKASREMARINQNASISDFLGVEPKASEKVAKEFSDVQESLITNIKKTVPQQFIQIKDTRFSDFISDKVQSPKITKSFSKIQKNLMKNIKQGLPNTVQKIDQFNVRDILDDDETVTDKIAKQFRSVKHKLLSSIKRAIPTTFKVIDPNAQEDMIGRILGENPTSSKLLRLRFRLFKHKMLTNLAKAIPSGGFDPMDNNITPDTMFGNIEVTSKLLRFRYRLLKHKLFSHLKKAFPSGGFDPMDNNVSPDMIFGSEHTSGIILRFRYRRLKTRLLKALGKAIPPTFDQMSSTLTPDGILGEDAKTASSFFYRRRFRKLKDQILKKINNAVKSENLVNRLMGVDDASILTKSQTSGETTSKVFEEMREHLSSIRKNVDSIALSLKGDKLQEAEDKRDAKIQKQRLADATAGSSGRGGGIGKKAGGMIGGAIGGTLSGILIGLSRGLKALSNPKLLFGVTVLAGLGGAVLVYGKAFQQFTEINWKNVFIGIGAISALALAAGLMGKFAPKILLGSLAIAALGGAMWVSGKAFQQFAEINWKTVAIGLGTLAIVGVIAAVISPALPAILAGSLAIAALGLALIPAAKAFEIFSRGAEPFANAMSTLSVAAGGFVEKVGDTVVKIFESLIGGIVDLAAAGREGGLGAAAKGIGAISAALIAFAGSTGFAGIANFFGGNPIKKFLELADRAPGLQSAADSIRSLGDAMRAFGDSRGFKGFSDGLDLLKQSLDKFSGRGLFNFGNRLKPLKELGSTLSQAFNGFSTTGVAMRAFGEGINLIFDGVNKIDGFFGAGAKFRNLERLLDIISKYDVELQKGVLMNSAQELYQNSSNNASLQNQARAASVATAINSVSSTNQTNISNNNATTTIVNNAGHVDQTMLNTMGANAF